MLKAVLFDMDGLIFDTESIYKQSWQYAATEQGLAITDDFYQQFIGVQDPECERILAEHFQQAIDMPRYKAVRDEHFHHLRDQGIALKPGFDSLLRAIKQRGLLTAIVTSSHLPEVKHNFNNTEYLTQFDLVITAEDVERGKPSPDCYQMACHHLGIDAKESLVLEDSNNGIKAALAAECHAVMIPDLLPPLQEFKDKVIIKASLEEVIPLLDTL
ncbi:TPA: HAD family phosphatase [Vibrio harveyi]|uniref:HAD hydrolase, IA, variant 3 family protein n=1 Tax=Vibrio harveyi TaxID=669 RepID=A0A454D5C9_VIBHA|nr:HAD family phosphatase [Vibrio harveyi]EKM33908.1 HAD hydrolase, IA, variant 3 family protein [Vibrio harveyi]EKO3813435.1 HAD family phosphatase [Vibrio harveyi]EKO3839835.1 HAD family phosphatase [Vibrio harveyi]EKO3846314.1 HAD family phosphatase [Vibrio harveyi]EKO3860962.1 HAD family phosphatase [Vibrio harveyi]